MSVPGGRHASTLAVEGRGENAPPLRSCLRSARSAPGSGRPGARPCRRIRALADSPRQARPLAGGQWVSRNFRCGPPHHLQRVAPLLPLPKAGRREWVPGAFPATCRRSTGQRRGARWRSVSSRACRGETTGRVVACPEGGWHLRSDPIRVYRKISYGRNGCASGRGPGSRGACQPRDPPTLCTVNGSLATPPGTRPQLQRERPPDAGEGRTEDRLPCKVHWLRQGEGHWGPGHHEMPPGIKTTSV